MHSGSGRLGIVLVGMGALTMVSALGLIGLTLFGGPTHAASTPSWELVAGASTIAAAVLLTLIARRLMKGLLDEIEQRENRLEELAGLDTLTQLYSRRLLQRRLEEEVAAALRYEHPVSLILFDIDDFQHINHRIGPKAADALLADIGRAARSSVRAADILGRWGGDELALLAPRTSAEEALRLAQRIQREIPQQVGQERVGLSVGFADLPACADQADSLIAAAETALGLAQRRRPNGLVYIKSLENVDLQPDDAVVLTQRLKTATVGTIRALATAVDKRDHYTHGHGKALEQMLQFVADRLGLDSKTRNVLLAGAELHDVGKIGIPDHILSKPGPLTADEYAVMKRHPEIGKDIVATVVELGDLVPAILCHHERWDGTGYPGGLMGDEIPLVARLIAIADAYHAMVSDRPYRAALTEVEAITELRRHAGSQFDPTLVDAFLESVAEYNLADQDLAEAA